MAALIAYYQAHQSFLAGIAPVIIALLDYFIGKNPSSPASGILHWLEIQIKSLLGVGDQQPPAK